VLAPLFVNYGIELETFVVENVSLPEELQKAIDTRISMGMAGDLNQYAQYQAANAIPLAAQNEGGMAGYWCKYGRRHGRRTNDGQSL
jgi:membrane protease subunit (stomatin/prohibitin family)